MSSSLLFLSFALGVSVSLLYKYLQNKAQKQKEKDIKSYLNSIVSLSVSHLHDASNFFALLKNNLADDSLSEIKSEEAKEALSDLRNFSRGASYHFRALFEELRDSKQLFDHADFDLLLKNKFNLFYKKEKINLKDLLELELFQVSDFKRIKFCDRTKNDYVWINGNFSLLSKVLLNLVENALKYTDGEIVIELSEEGSFKELKLFSHGEGIPEKTINDIKDSPFQKSYGHGFESIKDIMSFHDAEFDISTIRGSGSCVTLRFYTYNQEEQKAQKQYISKQTNFIWPVQLKWVLPALVLVFLSAFSVSNNMMMQKSYENLILLKSEALENKDIEILTRINSLLDNNQLNDYRELEKDFLSSFDLESRRLVSLTLLEKIKSYGSIYLEDYFLYKAISLYKDYPDSVFLNYSLSNLSFKNKKYYSALVYSARGLMSLIKSVIAPNKDLYFFDRLVQENKVLDYYKLHFNYPKEEVVRQTEILIKKPKILSKPQNSFIKSKKTKKKSNKPSTVDKLLDIKSDSAISDIDGLIDEQDSNLGIDFDL